MGISANAFADVPNCWSFPGVFAVGKYQIRVEKEQGKKTYDEVYKAVTQGVLTLRSEPSEVEREWFFSIATQNPSQAAMREAAEKQLFPLSKLKGVSISCSPIFKTNN